MQNKIDLQQFLKYTLTKELVYSFFNEKRKSEPEIEKEGSKIKEDFISVQNDDKLFWIYFVIVYGYDKYSMIHNYFLEEKKYKIDLISTVKSNKNLVKKVKMTRSNIECNLLNDKIISIPTFLYLCLLKKKNVVIFDDIKCVKHCNEGGKTYYINSSTVR